MIGLLLNMLMKSEAARKYMDARFGQVEEILKVIRSNPQGYDANQPSKKDVAK